MRTLLKLSGFAGDTMGPGHVVHKTLAALHLRTLNQFPDTEIQQRLNSYHKFIFVRHPLDRLVSVYRSKFHNPDNTYFPHFYGRDIISRYRVNATSESLATGRNVTFEEFVRYVIDTPDVTSNEHWQSHVTLCAPCAVQYDYVGRFAQLEADAARLLRMLGAPEVPLPPHPPLQAPWQQAYRALTPHLLVKLAVKYQIDFNMFGDVISRAPHD